MGLAFLITSENLQLLSERKVLKEAEYASLLDASSVIEQARAEAQRIVGKATAQVEESRQQGYEEGLARAQHEYAQRLISTAIDSERQLFALRASMANLVVKAVSQLVAGVHPAQLYEAALSRIDHLVRNEPFIVVKVTPADEEALRWALEKLRAEGGLTLNISIVVDPALAVGSCVVQTPSGAMEIGVNAQIEAFRKAVERGRVLE